MEQQTSKWKGKIDAYYDKDGGKAALCNLITANVPAVAIKAINDEGHDFATVIPLELITYLFLAQ